MILSKVAWKEKSIFCRLSLAECLPNYVSGIVAAHKKEKEGSRQSQQKKEKSKEKVIFFSLKSRVFSTAWFCVLLIQDEREL